MLLVDSPFISYIDVRHAKFLPPTLTIGEARDLGPRYTSTDDLAPVKDEFVEQVSQNNKRHEAIEQPESPAPIADKEAAEPIGTSGTKSDQVRKIVKQRTMTLAQFLPRASPVA